jgi:hypothetical protein
MSLRDCLELRESCNAARLEAEFPGTSVSSIPANPDREARKENAPLATAAVKQEEAQTQTEMQEEDSVRGTELLNSDDETREDRQRLAEENENLRSKLKECAEMKDVVRPSYLRPEQAAEQTISKLSLIILGKYTQGALSEPEILQVRRIFGDSITKTVNAYSQTIEELHGTCDELFTLLEKDVSFVIHAISTTFC